MTENQSVNSPMTMASHESCTNSSANFCDPRFMPPGGATSLLHSPATSYEGGAGGIPSHFPYNALVSFATPQLHDAGLGCSATATGSIHSQPTVMRNAGRNGSESDCRTTPIDSDIESAKSATLITYPFPIPYGQQAQQPQLLNSPQRFRTTGSPPVPGANERRMLPMGHAGLIGKFGKLCGNTYVEMVSPYR